MASHLLRLSLTLIQVRTLHNWAVGIVCHGKNVHIDRDLGVYMSVIFFLSVIF